MAGTSGNETSLKQIFQGMKTDSPELMEFTVISTSPLKLKATNDDKLIITERITVVPWHLTDYQTTVTTTETKAVTVHNALKVGEKVHVLSMNNGKQYYVLDRVA